MAEVDDNERFELTMQELRLMGGVGRPLVLVSTVLGVAMLSAGAASADGQVTTDAGSCLTVLSVFGNIGPGTRASSRWCNGDPGQGWDSVP